MKYLNLETSTLHSPEYIGCKPVARATWINVILWCSAQENGGKIAGARKWGNRQWQQTCGVTRKEIDGADPLLAWEGDDLIVFRYPVVSEGKVRNNSVAGQIGGGKTSEAKILAARENGTKGGRPKTQAETQAENPDNPSENPTECNGKEEKKKEGKGREDRASACGGPSLFEWLGRVEALGFPEWWEKKWFAAEKVGWMAGRSKIVNWETHQDSQMAWFRSYEKEQIAKSAPPAPPDNAAFEADLALQASLRAEAERKAQAELQAALAGGRE